jgi:hypothetical protein
MAAQCGLASGSRRISWLTLLRMGVLVQLRSRARLLMIFQVRGGGGRGRDLVRVGCGVRLLGRGGEKRAGCEYWCGAWRSLVSSHARRMRRRGAAVVIGKPLCCSTQRSADKERTTLDHSVVVPVQTHGMSCGFTNGCVRGVAFGEDAQWGSTA